MKTQFEKIRDKNPNLSSCMCFVKLVQGKKIGDKQLRKMFDDLVEKGDYVGTPKEQIITWLKKEILKK